MEAEGVELSESEAEDAGTDSDDVPEVDSDGELCDKTESHRRRRKAKKLKKAHKGRRKTSVVYRAFVVVVSNTSASKWRSNSGFLNRMKFLKVQAAAAADTSSQPAVLDDLTEFLTVELPEEADLLQFWAENEDQLPHLALMAWQFLGVPATSASAERLFSLADVAFDKKRRAMCAENLVTLSLMWAKINKFKASCE